MHCAGFILALLVKSSLPTIDKTNKTVHSVINALLLNI